MQHMTLNINQNILIVPIFDLQDVANETVCTQRVSEVFDGDLILFRRWLAILTAEVVNNSGVGTPGFFLD